MLATIHDEPWNMLNMQHIIPNSDIPYGDHEKIKGPTHIVQGEMS